MNNEIKTSDCDIYEVTLVVAVPNYGEGGADATALDYILNELDSNVTILSSSELLLSLIPTMVMPTNATTLAKATQATLAEEAFEIDEYLDEDAEFNNALLTVALAKLEQPVTLTVVEAHLAKHAKPEATPKKNTRQGIYHNATIKRQYKILAALAKVDSATAKQIAKATHTNIEQVYSTLYSLQKEALVSGVKQQGKVQWSAIKIWASK